MSEPDEREERSRRAAAAIVSGEVIASEDFRALRSSMFSTVRRTAGGMSHTETLDIVDASVEKLFRASVSGGLQAETALAYLRRIVRNETIDRLRRAQNPIPIESSQVEELKDEDAIARLIDQRATAAIIDELLKRIAERRDPIATKVIGAYLKLAAAYGESPSNRSVAEATEVSHTTVANVMDRLREEIAGWDFPD